MKECAGHHYEYRHGRFVCIRCGHVRYGKHRVKGYVTIGIICAGVIAVGIFLYTNSSMISDSTSKITKIIEPQITNARKTITKKISNFNEINTQILTNVAKPIPEEKTRQLPPATVKQSKPVINISDLEQKIHVLINTERQQHGLTDLRFDPILSKVARLHSQDMANRNYFEHDSPEGETFSTRYAKVGINCETPISSGYFSAGSENIFQGNLYNSVSYLNGVPISYDWNDMDRLARQTVSGWMHSSGHRDNILKPYHIAEGIGVAITSDDKVYVTEDFC